MASTEYSRMLAEGRIHNNFRRSHRWQKAVLGVTFSAGALAGAYDASTNGPSLEPVVDVSVAVAASLAGYASRIMTRGAGDRETENYAWSQHIHRDYRPYKTTINIQDSEIEVSRDYDSQDEVSVPPEKNFFPLLGPIFVYTGTMIASIAATNEHVRQLGETSNIITVGALVAAGGIIFHRSDRRIHEEVEATLQRQMDNIDDNKIFELDYSE